MTDFKGRYVAYFRVSTDKQDLDSQRFMLYSFLDKECFCKEFHEIESGKHMSTNKQLRETIEYCKNNNKILAVSMIDRLGRDAEHALSVHRELDGWLYACNIPTERGARMDRFSLTIFMAIAEREREIISIRTKQGLAARKAAGVKFGRKRSLTKKEQAARTATHRATIRRKKIEDPNYLKVLQFIENRVDDWVERTGKKPPRTHDTPSGVLYQEIASELNSLKFDIPKSRRSDKTNFSAAYVAKLYYNERKKIQIAVED
jgi:DNA invertase Pin-like site-specific DNA recombinase